MKEEKPCSVTKGGERNAHLGILKLNSTFSVRIHFTCPYFDSVTSITQLGCRHLIKLTIIRKIQIKM